MKHLLMDPAFPDIVGGWAERQIADRDHSACANDNGDEPVNKLADPLFAIIARREIEVTRVW